MDLRVSGEDDARCSPGQPGEGHGGLRPLRCGGQCGGKGDTRKNRENQFQGDEGSRNRFRVLHRVPRIRQACKTAGGEDRGKAACGERLHRSPYEDARGPECGQQGLGHKAVRPRGQGCQRDKTASGKDGKVVPRRRLRTQAASRFVQRAGRLNCNEPVDNRNRPIQRRKARNGRGIPRPHSRGGEAEGHKRLP